MRMNRYVLFLLSLAAGIASCILMIISTTKAVEKLGETVDNVAAAGVTIMLIGNIGFGLTVTLHVIILSKLVDLTVPLKLQLRYILWQRDDSFLLVLLKVLGYGFSLFYLYQIVQLARIGNDYYATTSFALALAVTFSYLIWFTGLRKASRNV